VPPQAFISLLLPNHYNTFDPPHYTGPGDLSYSYLYCGLLGLLLGGAGIVLARRHRLNRIFLVVLVCSAATTLADTTPLTRALYALLPTRIQIGLHPQTAAAPFTLALAMLAAVALQQMTPRAWRWPAVAIAALDLILVSSGRPMNAMPFRPDAGDRQAVTRVRALTETESPPARIDTVDDSLDWVMRAPATGIYTASGADVMAPERIIQARLAFCRGQRWGSWYQVSNLHSPVLGMMNVRYVLSREALADATPFRHAGTLPGRYVYENSAVLPRFYLVARTRVTRSLADSAAALRSADFRPAQEAIVEGGPLLAGAGAGGQVEVVRYGFQSLELKVSAPARRYLVTSETHYPGWRAMLDGHAQPIFYTNAAFRGLEIPEGQHTVIMRFEPASVRCAAVVSAAAWLIALLLWWRMPTWRGLVERRQEQQPEHQAPE
jgi:hypothetical protein